MKDGKVFISSITKVEIISVIGKYARGRSGGPQKCLRAVSETGELCQNEWYVSPKAKWSKRKVKSWLKLIQDTTNEASQLIAVEIIPFDEKTIDCAEKIISHALLHRFASMDAMIAATAKEAICNGRDMTVVTSDKGLIACLKKVSIPYWDAFHVRCDFLN